MTDTGGGLVCPHCKCEPVSPQQTAIALPMRTLLNDRFMVGRVLGQPGGFGITYLAWDTVLDTAVAIKEFLPLTAANREPGGVTVLPNSEQDREFFQYGLEIFLQEAKTLAQFSHPNIVRIRDYFATNNTAYLVMDYHQGRPLNVFVKENGGRLTEAQALTIMLPIMAGLEAMHDKGFLHRDVKPQNIYLTDRNLPVLLDFGAARMAMADATQTMTVMLSRGFAPFEQYHNKSRQGPWGDIYACGATLYYLVTGQVPADALERQHQDTLLPPLQLNPQISLEFSRAVMTAMAISPNARPKKIGVFRDRLTAAGQQALPARVVQTPPIAVNRAPPDKRQARYSSKSRGPGRAGVMLGAALLSVVVLVWLAGHRNSVNMPAKLDQASGLVSAELKSPFPAADNEGEKVIQTVTPPLEATATVPLYQPEPQAEKQVVRNNSPAGGTGNSCENKSRHADCLLGNAEDRRVGWCVPADGGQYVCIPKPAPGSRQRFPPDARHPPPLGFRR
ncbi:serine/threonine protein kinase [Methylomonas methanica]|nr:serine/threonine-protein kinase [Methylomonas methanica]